MFDKFESILSPLASVGTATDVGGVGATVGVLEMVGALLGLDGTFPPPHAQQCSVADPISPMKRSALPQAKSYCLYLLHPQPHPQILACRYMPTAELALV